LGDFFAALDYVLEDAGADDVAEGGLRAFDEGLADVADAEGGFVGGGDVVVDYGGELEVDVVFGHADLPWHLCGVVLVGFLRDGVEVAKGEPTNDLDLDVDLDELFGERVDFDETGVDCAVEATELGDEADVSLADWLVWVGADDAARDGTAESDACTEGIDWTFISM